MKKVIPTIVVLILLGVLGTIFYKNYWVRYSYSEEMTDVNEYYGVKGEDDYPVVLQDVLSDYHAKKIGDSSCTGHSGRSHCSGLDLQIRFVA